MTTLMKHLLPLCLFLLFTISCGPEKKPVQHAAAPIPAAKPHPEPEPAQPETPVEQIIEHSVSLFDQGMASLAVGDEVVARQQLDQSLLIVLECRDAYGQDPRLQAHLDELIDRIHIAETQHFSQTTISETSAAIEELLDITLIEPGIADQDAQEETGYNVPIERNAIVNRFLEVFTTNKAETIGAGLERSTQYLPMMRRIFKEEGLPLDLCYLPLIESAYKTRARSRAAAVGLWQFIAGTGRMYDLKIDWWVDERRDPEKSTRAAARYLKDLYNRFGDWKLALSAYNAGPGRVSRAIRRGGTRDFWELYRRRLIPRETRGYVPAFMAGVMIARNPDQHGFANLNYKPEIDTDLVKVDYGVDIEVLAEKLEISSLHLLELNPHLRRNATSSSGGSQLAVPAGWGDRTRQALDAIPPQQRLRAHMVKLKSGDTLGKLARRFNTSVKAIQSANNIRNPRRLRVGQNIMIPMQHQPGSATTDNRTRQLQLPSEPQLPRETLEYRVKRGDTLYHIAKRFQTTIPSIMTFNPEISPVALKPGQRLEIHQGDRSQKSLVPVRGKGYTLYRVATGDTIAAISRRYGVSMNHLLQFNGLNKRSTIYPGQRIKIPNAQSKGQEVLVYKVKKGDTLSAIAKRHNTRVGQLIEWNRLQSARHLRIGQKILIYR